MCQRFLYDNIISFVGAWVLFIFTLSLWYWIAGLCNHFYIRKHSVSVSFVRNLFGPFKELLWSYWSSC